MASSGSGTGTPISSGSGSANLRSIPRTILSLDRYAQIMGLNPVHFNQGYDETYFPVDSSCPDVWFKYHWQRPGYASRHDLAMAIRSAEKSIADVLGYWPGLKWVAEEEHQYDKFHRRYIRNVGWMPDVSGNFKSVSANYGDIISPGKRGVAVASTSAGVTYADDDSDGLAETATVTVDYSGTAAETVLNRAWYNLGTECRFGVYHDGFGGHPDWEIRYPVSVDISGTTITFTFRSWQLLLPSLLEEFPQLGSTPFPIDVSETSNFVSTVDVYLEYPDLSQPSTTFVWDGQRTCSICSGAGCENCGVETRNGCLNLSDPGTGILTPIPASYDATNEVWTQSDISTEYEPHIVKLWYLSGKISDEYRMGLTCDPLEESLAQAIAWLATARLVREPCGCGNTKQSMMELRKDVAIVSPEGNFVVGIDDALKNPFGTRLGEIRAWRSVARLAKDARLDGVAL